MIHIKANKNSINHRNDIANLSLLIQLDHTIKQQN